MSAIILTIKNYYSIKTDFTHYILHLAAIFIINLTSIILSIQIPFALLYVPVLIMTHFELCEAAPGKLIKVLCIMPFIFMTTIFILTKLPIKSDLFIIKFYNQIYNSILSFSLIISSVYILSKSKNWSKPLKDSDAKKITIMLLINLMIGILLLINVENSITRIKSYDRILFLLVPLTIINAYLIISFLFNYMKSMKYLVVGNENQKCLEENENYLSDSYVETINTSLNSAMKNDNLYLKYNISLDKLANHIGITRSDLSIFLNQNLKKPFYKYIAELRINYILYILENNMEILTNEDLLYLSGFNSISTFNKHFKENTGLSVADYKKNILKV